MDMLPLLDELQVLARNGLTYAQNPYDRERYAHLLELASLYYGAALDLPPAEVRQRLAADLGHVTPKVGADAAIFDPDGRLLLMQRADDCRWCLPCGWVEPLESPAEAAVRETREETGLEVRPVQLVDVFTRLPSAMDGPHTVVAVVYLCVVTGGALQRSHEGLDLRYWCIPEVPSWHANHERYAVAASTAWRAHAVTRSPTALGPGAPCGLAP
jgi:ADP-ribose pyrophosphatase YjhB (NUDIX family)